MAEEFGIKGLKELDKLLATLPLKVQRNVLRGTLRAGAKVIMDDAKLRVPVGPPSGRNKKRYGGYAGALRDSLRIRTRVRGGLGSARVIAGGKNKKTGADVYYAHIVEGGAEPHLIKGPVRIGGKVFRNIKHPGMQARPFMRPALDAKSRHAVLAAGNYMKRRLATKHGLDVADITVEED